MIEPTLVLTNKQREDGWVEWGGGECPVAPDTVVRFKLRMVCDKYFVNSYSIGIADNHRWHHDEDEAFADIVAYCVVKPEDILGMPLKKGQLVEISSADLNGVYRVEEDVKWDSHFNA